MLQEIMESIKHALSEPTIDSLTHKEKENIYDLAYQHIEDYMSHNLFSMKKPNFHNDLNDSILEILQNICENIYNEELEEELRVIVQKACRTYFSHVLPRRSYSKTFVKPRVHKKKIAEIIDKLRAVPQHEQRTREWYEDRWNMISASSAWKALASEAHKNSIIYEKCTPLNTEKYTSVNVDSPFHWGQKYEPLSVQIYEKRYNTKVEDFGCIPHPDYPNAGASPDGINTDSNSTRYGRMLEVKNRFSESVPITGNPKEEYWIQMQMQMNVCDLNECDFLETRFKEYQTYNDFYADGSDFKTTADGKLKGIYLCFQKDGMPHYEYPELDLSQEDFEIWQENIRNEKEKEGYEWISCIYWYLDKYSCVLVFRNRKWFDIAIKQINEVWNTILKERVTGYEHRAPNRRVRKISDPSKATCLIDVNLLKI